MTTYTRLFSDDKGESHFADVEIDFKLSDYAPPTPPLELSAFANATEFGFLKAPAGWSSDWHTSAGRSAFFVLSGEWEVTASDGDARKFKTGSALLAEDTNGKGHRSRVLSNVETVALMVRLEK